MKVQLIFPPFCDVLSPPSCTATLKGYLESRGVKVQQIDANLIAYDSLLKKETLQEYYGNILKEINLLRLRGYLSDSQKQRLLLLKKALFIKPVIDNIEKITMRCKNRMNNAHEIIVINNLLNIISRLHFPFSFNLNGVTAINEKVKQIIENANGNSLIEFLGSIDNSLLLKLLGNHVIKEVGNKNVNFIGISIIFYPQLITALSLAKLLKEKNSNTPIVLGGPFVSTLNDSIKRSILSLVEVLVEGEGEEVLYRLAVQMEKKDKNNFENIPNIIYMRDKKIRFNKIQNITQDKSSISSFGGLKLNSYFKKSIMVQLETSKGCYWNKCLFCYLRIIKEHENYRQKNLDSVIKEICAIVNKHKVRDFFFIDAAIPPERMEELSMRLINLKLDIRWAAYSRFDRNCSQIIFNKMAKSGCLRLLFGLESGSQQVLDSMCKGIKIKNIENILRMSSNANIENHVFIIIGYPTETYKDIKKTVNFIIKNSDYIDKIFIYPFIMIRPKTHSYFLKNIPNPIGLSFHNETELIKRRDYFCKLLPLNIRSKLVLSYP